MKWIALWTLALTGCAGGLEAERALIDQRRLDEAYEALQAIGPGEADYALALAYRARIHSIREQYDLQVGTARRSIDTDWRVDDANAFNYLWAGLLRGTPHRDAARALILEEAEALLVAHPEEMLAYAVAASAASVAEDEERVRAIELELFQKFPASKEAKDRVYGYWAEVEAEKDAAKRLELMDAVADILPHVYWRNKFLSYRIRTIAKLRGPEAAVAACDEWMAREPKSHYAVYVASLTDSNPKELARATRLATRAEQMVRAALANATPEEREELLPLRIAYLWQRAESLLGENKTAEAVAAVTEALEQGKQLTQPTTTVAALVFMNGLSANSHWLLGLAYEKLGDTYGAMDNYALAAAKSDSRNQIAAKAEKALLRLYGKRKKTLQDLQRMYSEPAAVFIRFEDVTEAWGLKDVKSSGVSVGDYNGDGFADVSVGGRLWRNDGGKGLMDVTAETGFSGGTWADLDNDGDLDAVTGDYKAHLNDGHGKFKAIGLGIPDWAFEPDDRMSEEKRKKQNWYSGAIACLDFDGDGLLDIYFANVPAGIHTGHGFFPQRAPDFFYRNLGGGRFEEVSQQVGITKDQTRWCGYGLACADYDNDGDTDIFVSNYSLHPNVLWRNDGKGRFVNVSHQLDLDGTEQQGYWGHTIGSVWGDIDNDGDLDLVCSNLAHPRYIEVSDATRVYRNGGGSDPEFKDVTAQSGVAYDETHSDVSLMDVDNDGDLDLFLTQIYDPRRTMLYENDGAGHFRDITWYAGVRHFDAWQHAWADLDHDGKMDLIVASNNSGVRLYHNRSSQSGPWLKVRAKGTHCNAGGVGARVTVESDLLGEQIREIVATRGNGPQDEAGAHFGLREGRAPLTVTVRFPCGATITREDVKANQVLLIEEGE